jgi:predicted NAD/FAD-binding protein
MRVAVVGAGVAGLTVTYLLSRAHDVELFERNDYPCGHVRTLKVNESGRDVALDAGFVVFNEQTYPGFTQLLRDLDVRTQAGDMSFSVACRACGLEYSSKGIPGLLAQQRNVFRPNHWQLAFDILRFYRDTERILDAGAFDDATVGSYLRARHYGGEFARHYLIPLGAAIWSAPPGELAAFPLRYCLGFLHNHGLIGRGRVHQWLTVVGGAKNYVDRMVERFPLGVRLSTPVTCVSRGPDGVRLRLGDGELRDFDRVVFACHADEALALLADASHEESHALGGFTYKTNEAVLHTAGSFLPRHERAKSSWNYQTPNCRSARDEIGVTYHLNRLQSIRSDIDYCVTLNARDRVPAGAILREMTYQHPQYTFRALEAQRALTRLNGVRHTFFAGAHMGFGFHEDGYQSAVRVAAEFGIDP